MESPLSSLRPPHRRPEDSRPVENGAAVTQTSPSNAALLYETERAVYPPEQVCRYFDFVDGVPPEYYAFTGPEHHRGEKATK